MLANARSSGSGTATKLSGSQTATAAHHAAHRLDFHHHYASPGWKEALRHTDKPGMRQLIDYNPLHSIERMDAAGVQTSFLSITTPGVFLGDDYVVEQRSVRTLARDMNDYGARLVADHAPRFGLFATLPLPDIDASLREIEYAFGTLHADGIGLLTSYASHWLGNPLFTPILEELDRRHALVFVHPTNSPCCQSLGNANPAKIEWLTDTARCIMSIIGEIGFGPDQPSPATLYPNIRFIWSHAGGSLVAVAARVVGDVSRAALSDTDTSNLRLKHIRRFHYDTAGSANEMLLQALAKLAGSSQIVFGSDYPYVPITNIVEGLRDCGFSASELQGIDWHNGAALVPRYA